MAKIGTKKKISPNWQKAIERGDQHLSNQEFSQAARFYRKALKISTHPLIYVNLGIALQNLGKLDRAIDCFEKSVSEMPSASGFNNLGGAFLIKGMISEAIDCYQKALRFKVDPAILNNIGDAYRKIGRSRDAVNYYERALDIEKAPHLYLKLADLHLNYDNWAEAEECLRNAVELDSSPINLERLATVLMSLGKADQAANNYSAALNLDERFHRARFGYLFSKLRIVYTAEEEIVESRIDYASSLDKLHTFYQELGESDRRAAASSIGDFQPYYLPYQGQDDRRLQEQFGRLAQCLMAARYPEFSERRPVRQKETADGKLRVGFVVSFHAGHSVWKIPTRGWVANIDRSKFDVFGYVLSAKLENDIVGAFSDVDVIRFGKTMTTEWAQTILEDELDILIYPEIGMDGRALRLACLRLAGIQATSFGHPVTSGLATIDYYLSCEVMEPSEGDGHYVERLVRLPALGIDYQRMGEIETPCGADIEIGQNSKRVRYWCCQSTFKYLPQNDDVFPRISLEVPQSEFVFIEAPRSELLGDVFKRRLEKSFSNYGLRWDDHCIFLPRMSTEKFAAAARSCDVFLDNIGWSGFNSALESVRFDLPIVTFPGQFMRERHCYGILQVMGLGHLAAGSKEDYISKAVQIGTDNEYRANVRNQISMAKHKLYEGAEAIRGLEEFFLRAIDELG